MKMKMFSGAAIVAGFVATQAAHAEDGPKLGPWKASVGYEFGQLEQGKNNDQGITIDKEILNRATVWMWQEAEISESIHASYGVGGGYFFVYPRLLGANPFTHTKRSGFGLSDAHGEFLFAGSWEENHAALLKVGIINYKYNPDAKNLGEYMFRTWTYPTVIMTGGFDFINSASAQLSGAILNTKMGGFNNDLILSVQTERAPTTSLSITDMASYNVGGFLEIGGGLMWDNFYAADPKAKTPEAKTANHYYVLTNGEKMSKKEYDDLLSDPVAGPALAANLIADTLFYSFEGFKAVGRISLDIGALLGNELFGQDAFKLYSEVVLMGIENRPTYYETQSERTAYLFGINIPTFQILNMLNVEVEWCSNPYPNSTQGVYGQGAATPPGSDIGKFPNPLVEKDDNLKWSVYAKKDVVKGFSIFAQIASDHSRVLNEWSSPNSYDLMLTKTQWYWLLRLQYSI